MMKTAKIIHNLIPLQSNERMPDGVQVATVSCSDYATFNSLPAAIEVKGLTLGLTGWNSDSNVAYYRSDAHFATVVE